MPSLAADQPDSTPGRLSLVCVSAGLILTHLVRFDKSAVTARLALRPALTPNEYRSMVQKLRHVTTIGVPRRVRAWCWKVNSETAASAVRYLARLLDLLNGKAAVEVARNCGGHAGHAPLTGGGG